MARYARRDGYAAWARYTVIGRSLAYNLCNHRYAHHGNIHVRQTNQVSQVRQIRMVRHDRQDKHVTNVRHTSQARHDSHVR